MLTGENRYNDDDEHKKIIIMEEKIQNKIP